MIKDKGIPGVINHDAKTPLLETLHELRDGTTLKALYGWEAPETYRLIEIKLVSFRRLQ